MFPITKTQLLQLRKPEVDNPHELVQDIVVLRIVNEIFNAATKGAHRYTCDIETRDTIDFITRLMKMFPDCTIEVKGEILPNWSCLTIRWD